MGSDAAKSKFNKKQWEDGLKLNRCTSCGECESRCPNGLPVMDIIENAKSVLYTR